MRHTFNKVWRRGDVFIWLSGAGLALSLIMIAGLLFAIFFNAAQFFWPRETVSFFLEDGRTILGEVTGREAIPDPDNPEAVLKHRIQVKQGNRDIHGIDFLWIDEEAIRSTQKPADSMVVERREWGNFYGYIKEVRDKGKVIARGPEMGLTAVHELLPASTETHEKINEVARDDIGAINHSLEKTRLDLKVLAAKGIISGREVESLKAKDEELQKQYRELEAALTQLRKSQTAEVVFTTSDGQEKVVPISLVIRVYAPNSFGWLDRTKFFISKVIEFVTDEPREANTEGGVFPAIFGTVMMVLIMSLMATPLGVLAAFYLREYARQGPMVSAVRIAVNNLAGVPSIVFGVFGVGFFIYFVGGSIDNFFFSEALPAPTFGTGGILWASLTMALLTVPVVIVSTEEGLASVSNGTREASLALGATKFETTWRVVLPAVMPSILTGLILAMARAAGEVAPLMITGVVKLAPSLPVDGIWPFVHLERKFMHLGFHIYDVGFQSPNVDAARPMVFTTTLLLIVIILMLNFTAILLRNRLRKKLAVSGV
ncbi:MAG: phosphate transport system permease protein PstA [Nitrospinaceae bacterium]|nr:MAG: phosphate transport system permease protein PstA [Nitrospinaceae bacterium]